MATPQQRATALNTTTTTQLASLEAEYTAAMATLRAAIAADPVIAAYIAVLAAAEKRRLRWEIAGQARRTLGVPENVPSHAHSYARADLATIREDVIRQALIAASDSYYVPRSAWLANETGSNPEA